MAKFVVIAREALADLIRGIGSKTAQGLSGFEKYTANRAQILESYKKATGREVPQGQVVVPKRLHQTLVEANKRKKFQTSTQQYEAERIRRKSSNRESREDGYTREQPKRDRKKGPLFPMEIGKRTYEEGQRMLTLKAEREAARSGRKINRTNHVTRRDIAEDTF